MLCGEFCELSNRQEQVISEFLNSWISLWETVKNLFKIEFVVSIVNCCKFNVKPLVLWYVLQILQMMVFTYQLLFFLILSF